MDFMFLKVQHSRIDTARNAAVEAFSFLAYAADLCKQAGAFELAVKLVDIGHQALALDFTIPPPKR